MNVRRAKEFINSLSKEFGTGRTGQSFVKFWELEQIFSMLDDSECCKNEVFDMKQIIFCHSVGCSGKAIANINHIWCEKCKRTMSI